MRRSDERRQRHAVARVQQAYRDPYPHVSMTGDRRAVHPRNGCADIRGVVSGLEFLATAGLSALGGDAAL